MIKRINPFQEIYRKCNSGTNLEKYEACLKKEIEWPRYIDIELTNNCNIHCYMCPVGTKAMKRERGFMSLETVEKICDEIKRGKIAGVRLIRWGEPTIHPRFLEILKMLKETNCYIHFNTNGIFLNESMMESIVDLQIDSIKFSFQGVDRHSYEEMRSGSDWERILENIIRLNQIRGEKEKPYIQISTTIIDEDQKRVEHFKKWAEQWSDYCNIGKTEMVHLRVEDMEISDERKQQFMRLRDRESQNKCHLGNCPEVYDKLSINWDGQVTACCGDWDNQLLVGDIYKDSLKTIFANERMRRIQKLISENQYDKIPICRTCFECIELIK